MFGLWIMDLRESLTMSSNKFNSMTDRNLIREEMTENVKSYFQRLIPFIFSLLLIFLSYVPLDFFLSENIRPAVAFVCVYYWIIHRPDIFNLFSVYFLGLIEDVLSSVPMGTNILSLLVLYILLLNFGRFFNGKPFIVTWYGFAIVCLLTMLTKWLMVSIYYGQFLPFAQVAFSYLFSVAAYPVLSLLNAFVQNYLIQDEV